VTASWEQAGPGALVRALNVGADVLGHIGLTPSKPDADKLVARAERTSGLHGGDARFLPAFRSAIASAEQGAGLTPFGRWGVSEVAKRMLDNRLRIADLIRRNPEIEATDVSRPIVVVGFYRSGTTLLHRLLSQAKGARVPRAFELNFPVPEGGGRSDDEHRRIAKMAHMLRLADLAIPTLSDMHKIVPLSPEESTVLLDNEGLGVYFLHAFGAHDHGWYLSRNDLHYAFESLKRQLQLLAWSAGEGRWVLKCPFTLWKLDELLDVFPDARVVHIHRDVKESLPSVCSLSAILQRGFRREVDPHEVGRFWSEYYLDGLKRSMQVRSKLPEGAVIDVSYRELMRDPSATVRKLAKQLDLDIPLGDQTRGASEKGKHEYTLQQFGLDGDELSQRFSAHLPAGMA